MHKASSHFSMHFYCTCDVSSAGVGRTGTFLALDYLIEQAATEGIVDIYGTVDRMRTERVNMIQTLVS